MNIKIHKPKIKTDSLVKDIKKPIVNLWVFIFFTINPLSVGAGAQTQLPIKKLADNQSQVCQDNTAWGLPIIAKIANIKKVERDDKTQTIICRGGYTVQYDIRNKTPLWVGQVIQPSSGRETTNRFLLPDPSVHKSLQASITDYAGSGFDIAQLAPPQDMQNDVQVTESFYATNTVPIVGPNMNRGVWLELEIRARVLAANDGMLVVFTGPVYKNKIQKLGGSQIAIPSHLYKIIYRPSNQQIISYLVHNVQIQNEESLEAGNSMFTQTLARSAMRCNEGCILEDFRVNLKLIEEATGLVFFPNLHLDKTK